MNSIENTVLSSLTFYRRRGNKSTCVLRMFDKNRIHSKPEVRYLKYNDSCQVSKMGFSLFIIRSHSIKNNNASTIQSAVWSCFSAIKGISCPKCMINATSVHVEWA